MRALLLAAGLGTRLRPITNSLPKVLVPIHGRPLLDYWLELLFQSNVIDRVLINTHYFSDMVEAHIKNSIWRERVDLVYEADLLGTGGSIKAHRHWFEEGGDFFVAHADNLTDFDISSFVDAHQRRPAPAIMSMLAFNTDVPKQCGIVELDKIGMVKSFHEKVENPPGNLANAAAYLLSAKIFDELDQFDRTFIDFSVDVLPKCMGRIYAVVTDRYYRDIGTVESLERAHREFPVG